MLLTLPLVYPLCFSEFSFSFPAEQCAVYLCALTLTVIKVMLYGLFCCRGILNVINCVKDT